MRNRMKKWLPMLFMFLLLFILAVPVQAEGMKINKEELSILKGKSYTLKVTGTTKKPTWISVDPSIATVSPSGKVTAKRCGWTIIIADCYSEAEFCDVYVTEKPKVNSHVSYYATIPALDVTLKNRENDVKYGASCTKFLYCYYAYCVKDWGSKNLTYTDESGARVTNTLKRCSYLAVACSTNSAARAVFDYIRTDKGRWAEYQKWLKKVLGGQTVPVLSSGYKYRVGYNSSSAYCPYTTAKENATFWQYLYRDSFSKKSKMKLIRYKNFYYWADKNTQLFSDCPNISSEHGKMGHWIPYGKAPSATSVETYGAMYTITLDDGKTYPMYVSYLEDYKKSGSERISLNVDKIAQYMIYQGNRKLKALGKI